MDIHKFWRDVLRQDASAIKTYVDQEACIRWHNTNEQFSVDEFIQANCEYPDKWDGEVERINQCGDLIITATHVYAVNKPLSFHVVSFIKIKDDKIAALDEYWGDDGPVPKWRLDKHIGKHIVGGDK